MGAAGSLRVGVYADVSNMYINGGRRMRYDVLRDFACRDSAEPIRLNAYVSYDRDRSEADVDYRRGAAEFQSLLRDYGYKVIIKTVRWYVDETGKRFGKANADLDLAVDVLLQSNNLDRVVIASGDGDFLQVVRALQNKGCRVEIVALENVSAELRREADLFMSGFLIPSLIPLARPGESRPPEGVNWGEVGSRVRGICYWHHADQGFGFMRFMKKIRGITWQIDSRQPDSPYGTVYFHDSNLPRHIHPAGLPSRHVIFEFTIAESNRDKNKLQAEEIEAVAPAAMDRPE